MKLQELTKGRIDSSFKATHRMTFSNKCGQSVSTPLVCASIYEAIEDAMKEFEDDCQDWVRCEIGQYDWNSTQHRFKRIVILNF